MWQREKLGYDVTAVKVSVNPTRNFEDGLAELF